MSMRRERKRIGDVLMERGVVTTEQLDQALQMQRESGLRLGEVLAQHLGVSKTEIASAIEQVQGVAYAECPPESVAPECLALIPRATAAKCHSLPLKLNGNVLIVAMAEPQNLDFIDEMRFRSGKQISPRFSYREDIELAIRRIYDGEKTAEPNAKSEPASVTEPVPASPPAPASEPVAVNEPAPVSTVSEPVIESEPVAVNEPAPAESAPAAPLVLKLVSEEPASAEPPPAAPLVLRLVSEEPAPADPPLVPAHQEVSQQETVQQEVVQQEVSRQETGPQPMVLRTQEPPNLTVDSPEVASLANLEFVLRGAWTGKPETRKELLPGARKATPALRSVAEILLKVVERESNAFHIEPTAQGTIVKVYGASHESMPLPEEARHSIISMIKMLSCLNDAERSMQHGGFVFGALGRRFDAHVTVMPTYFGEKAFLRLLDSSSECSSLSQLGLAQDQAKALEGILQLPQGMLLVAGPPATGRTQVLAAALNHLRSSGRSIVAIEDATEHLFEGVTHIQLGSRFDWDASSCLRSVLRQNADVIMIGELRDAITAELALRASRNGRLILSALVADDTADAFLRLRDFGIPQRLIASVSGIVSPRTVRTRCSCRRELNSDAPAAAGCALCGSSGFRGSTGIYEVLVVEGNVRAALEDEASPSEIRDILRGTAIRTLHEDAMEKVMAGLTTLDEVLKVLPRRKTGSYPSCSECSEPLAEVFRYCPYCGCSIAKDAEVSAKTR